MKNKTRDNKPLPKIDPRVKDILLLLAGGTFITASLVFPGLPIITKETLKAYEFTQWQKRQKEWKKFNTWRLRQVIKRMEKQKLVEIAQIDKTPVVKITEKGRQRILKFKLEEIQLDQANWNGKWQIIIYDIATTKRWQRELFRRMLKRMNFYQLQKSVYLTPFKCSDEIEYLRQICEVGNEVLIFTISSLENEQAYKDYFGLS